MSKLPDDSNQTLTDRGPNTPVKPDAPTVVPCKACGPNEPPDEGGLCPVKACRCFRASNTVALVHGARRKFTASMIERRDTHAAALFAERGGRSALDVITQLNVIEFADLTVQYEDVTAYLMDAGTLTQAGRERAAVKHALDISARREKIGALLHVQAPAVPSTPVNYDDMTEDQLLERMTTVLRSLLETRDEQRKGEAHVAQAVAEHQAAGEGYIVLDPGDPGYEEQEALATPAPEVVCPYCRRKCVGPDHVAYETLHWSDPAEVKKRDERATAVMRQQLGKLPDWYR